MPAGARFLRYPSSGKQVTVTKVAGAAGWSNTHDKDKNKKKKDKTKKNYTQEEKKAYNKKKIDKKREKRKMVMKTCKMAQTMIGDVERHKEEMDELRKELPQVKRYSKEMDEKMDTVITQTKKKMPVKRPPKPKDDESGPKKVFTAAQLKKLVTYEK